MSKYSIPIDKTTTNLTQMLNASEHPENLSTHSYVDLPIDVFKTVMNILESNKNNRMKAKQIVNFVEANFINEIIKEKVARAKLEAEKTSADLKGEQNE